MVRLGQAGTHPEDGLLAASERYLVLLHKKVMAGLKPCAWPHRGKPLCVCVCFLPPASGNGGGGSRRVRGQKAWEVLVQRPPQPNSLLYNVCMQKPYLLCYLHSSTTFQQRQRAQTFQASFTGKSCFSRFLSLSSFSCRLQTIDTMLLRSGRGVDDRK